MKFLIVILVVSVILIPLLIVLARKAYKAICLARSRSQVQDAQCRFELVIKFLLIDILVLAIVAIMLYDLIKGGF